MRRGALNCGALRKPFEPMQRSAAFERRRGLRQRGCQDAKRSYKVYEDARHVQASQLTASHISVRHALLHPSHCLAQPRLVRRSCVVQPDRAYAQLEREPGQCECSSRSQSTRLANSAIRITRCQVTDINYAQTADILSNSSGLDASGVVGSRIFGNLSLLQNISAFCSNAFNGTRSLATTLGGE